MDLEYWRSQEEKLDEDYVVLCEKMAQLRGISVQQADSEINAVVEANLNDGTTLEYECGSEDAVNGIFIPALVNMPCVSPEESRQCREELTAAGIECD